MPPSSSTYNGPGWEQDPLHAHPPREDGYLDDDADGNDMKKLVAKETPNFDGHWSKDSKKIVFVLDILQGTMANCRSTRSMPTAVITRR